MKFKTLINNRIKGNVERFNDNSLYADEYEVEAVYNNSELNKSVIEIVYTKKSESWDKRIKRRLYITMEEGT